MAGRWLCVGRRKLAWIRPYAGRFRSVLGRVEPNPAPILTAGAWTCPNSCVIPRDSVGSRPPVSAIPIFDPSRPATLRG